MEVWIKSWNPTFRMMQDLFCFFLVLITMSSQICAGQESPNEDIQLNYTVYSNFIEFETEYDDFNITSVTCELLTRSRAESGERFVCEDLEPCTQYLVSVRVRFYDNRTSTTQFTEKTLYEEPIVTINEPLTYPDSIYLSWNVTNRNCVKDVEIQVKGNGLNYIRRNPGSSVLVDGLQPCLTYNATLNMTDVNDKILSIASLDVRTERVDPGPVQNVQIRVNENSAVVTWDLPVNATCVEFYNISLTTPECNSLDETAKDCDHRDFTISSTAPRRQVFDKLEGCQNYFVKIIVNAEDMENDTMHEFAMDILDPGPVLNLTIVTISSTNITIGWTTPLINHLCVQYYIVVISNNNETFNTTETSISFGGLMPCGTYEIQVAAVSQNGTVGTNQSTQVILGNAIPTIVRNIEVQQTATDLSISWKPPEFASLCIAYYHIYAWYDEGSKLIQVKDEKTNATFTYISGLVSCMTHSIRITPVTKSTDKPDGETAEIEAVTDARLVNETKEFDIKTIYSRGVELRARSTDDSNNCEVFFGKFSCDAGAENSYAETIVPFIMGPHFPYVAVVEPLLPATQYVCTAEVYNVLGWSKIAPVTFRTNNDYPGAPVDVVVHPLTSSSFNIKWKTPVNRNGVLTLYNVHIQMIGPSYRIPARCQSQAFQEEGRTQSIAATETEHNYTTALPSVEYSIQVAAVNEMGVGEFSRPVTVTTKPSQSAAVNDFQVKSLEGPELADTYIANVTLNWTLPCYSNGRVETFKGEFLGRREADKQQMFSWNMTIANTDLENSDNFELFIDTLEPEYNYTVTIFVVIEDGVDSLITNLAFISPAGIPTTPNMSYNGDVDVFAAPNPTESAYIRFSSDILESNMGKVLYVALLISEKGCQQDPPQQMALIRSQENWPDTPTWRDVQHESCIRQYQTTPKRWSPTPVPARGKLVTKIVQYIIGDQDCTNSFTAYCNGPLKPGVEYALVVRLFTSTGYRDSNCIYFKTDLVVEIQFVLLLIISCLLIAFFAGFLYLWVTKKYIFGAKPIVNGEEHTGDITSKNFREYYEEIIKTDKLSREFKELTAISNELNLSNVASTSNETKNRYSNIFPYDKNRVILDCDSDGADYINASFINGYKRRKEYIATQGPKPETFVDFWRMVIQYNVRLIVMVTQFREGDKLKCHQYFPFINKEMRLGHNITVECKKETHYENYVRRELLVEHFSDCISRTVVHHLFRKWPDHDCPEDVTHLIDFVRKVRSEKIPRHSPFVVHCSAGVGRTGTFIGLDIIMQRLKGENRISIYDTVKELRFQRMKMVQTIQQYQFLYKCAYHLVKNKHSSETKCNGKKSISSKSGESSNETILSNGNGDALANFNGKMLSRAESIM